MFLWRHCQDEALSLAKDVPNCLTAGVLLYAHNGVENASLLGPFGAPPGLLCHWQPDVPCGRRDLRRGGQLLRHGGCQEPGTTDIESPFSAKTRRPIKILFPEIKSLQTNCDYFEPGHDSYEGGLECHWEVKVSTADEAGDDRVIVAQVVEVQVGSRVLFKLLLPQLSAAFEKSTEMNLLRIQVVNFFNLILFNLFEMWMVKVPP